MNLQQYTNTNIDKCFIEQYMFGYCTDLAKSLNIKTDLPIYAVINGIDRKNGDYDHYFICINDMHFIDVCGIHTIDDIKQRWSNIFKISINDVCVEKTNLDDENIGDYENTNKIADYLINKFELSYTKKYEKIKNIMDKLIFISVNMLGFELYNLIDKNNGCNEDYDDKEQIFLMSIITKINLVSKQYGYISNYIINIYFGLNIISYTISSDNIEIFLYDLLDYIV